MEKNGCRKVTHEMTSLDEWIDLNFVEVPEEAVRELYEYRDDRNEERELHRLDSVCDTCKGVGEVEVTVEDADDPDNPYADMAECPTCEGTGCDHADCELNHWPASWGTMWRADDDTDLVAALVSAGFVVYRAEGGPFHEEIIFGVDGGGYGFHTAHWAPLRLFVARAMTVRRREYRDRNGRAFDAVTLKLLTDKLTKFCEENEAHGGETFLRRVGG